MVRVRARVGVARIGDGARFVKDARTKSTVILVSFIVILLDTTAIRLLISMPKETKNG